MVPATHRDVFGRGGGRGGGGGVPVVSGCAGRAGGRDAGLHAVVLGGVAVVGRGQHHGGLVRLRVLVVEVDHASAAVRGRRNTANQTHTHTQGQF